ncbi:carboxypeptidase-like regulatory domain-containing protein [Aquimarina algiphila]|uniref:Carboxypeptidase-like regulatory domain-containing protein n=1 Tax=Aquimarina algiphila TaxID=2047982 RepID=A0A554VHD8_9FLAO|nr:carboxypeptidase-like regulatory domain-containing protein [Aquimarina algiphila]TSE06923.1 carboxypeptidase-like regulatory domain-containing protein [Aquimarina algiphila]
MKKLFPLLLLFLAQIVCSQTYTVLDSVQKTPISYATISFGNGNGTFADADGRFQFSKKWYSDIDSLYISAVGHKEKTISTTSLDKYILLVEDIAELKEVYITAEKKRKYKTKKIASEVHNDYFKSWLPTVESEIAVFFPRNSEKSTKIASVYLPIKTESSNRNSNSTGSFSTLFKMQFYENDNGFPGKRLSYEDIIFKVTDKDKSNFELNVSEHRVFVPKEGFFVSIQVLGYADTKGKLQQTKKYSEIETRKGIVKVSTTFRPLLPFTDKISGYKTFTRRIFFKNRAWQRFDKEYSNNNNLIKNNNTNYGMGLKLHLYEDN